MKWEGIQGFFRDKKKERIIYIVVMIGVLLLAIGNLDFGGHAKESGTEPDVWENYAEELEQNLTSILEEIDGAGRVKVMITFESGGEKVRATDSRVAAEESKTESEETTVNRTESGQTSPFVIKERVPKARGVIVVADGGGDPNVAANIKQAVAAAVDVYSHNITVFPRKQ